MRAGLLKLLLSFEHGMLPGNLHFNKPNPRIQSLGDGSIKVGLVHCPLYVHCNGSSTWQVPLWQKGSLLPAGCP